LVQEFQEKLEVKFDYSPLRDRAAAYEVRAFSQLVGITNTLKVVKTDPDDDKVLESAVVGDATHIVTGDRHLLPLGSYHGISIVAAADFLTLVSMFASLSSPP
jgi:predicted nucleic acid-binding protein